MQFKSQWYSLHDDIFNPDHFIAMVIIRYSRSRARLSEPLALPITCRGIFTMPVAFEQAFMVTLSLLNFLPLADYSKISLRVSSPLAADTRRV